MNQSTSNPGPALSVVVRTAEDWARVNELAEDFADGVIREYAVLGGDYVDERGLLNYGPYPAVIAYAQMQVPGNRRGLAVTLRFSGVRRVVYEHAAEVSPAIARPIVGSVWEVEVLSLRITAGECAVSVVGAEGLGQGPFILDR